MAVRVVALVAAAALLFVAGFLVSTDKPDVLGIAREVSAEDLDALGLSIEPSDVRPAIGRDEALRRALDFHHGGAHVRGMSYGVVNGRPSWLLGIEPEGFIPSCGPPRAQPTRCESEPLAAAIIVDATTGDAMSHVVGRILSP